MFGSEVPFNLVHYPSSLLRFICLVQGPHCMSVQIVTYQHYLLRSRVVFVHYLLQKMSKVLGCAPLSDRHSSPSPQRLTHHEHVDHPTSLVFIILSCIPSFLLRRIGSRWKRLSAQSVRSQLFALLVYAHYWIVRIVRSFV